MTHVSSLANSEKVQRLICITLEQLARDYQPFHTEIFIINREIAIGSDNFTVSEEIELLTTNLCGYGNQIKHQKYIQNSEQALVFLKKTHIFEIQSIVDLYLSQSAYFPHTKQYLQKLDYLKFLLIDWLENYQTTET